MKYKKNHSFKWLSAFAFPLGLPDFAALLAIHPEIKKDYHF
jgi:hypothetical protein